MFDLPLPYPFIKNIFLLQNLSSIMRLRRKKNTGWKTPKGYGKLVYLELYLEPKGRLAIHVVPKNV